VTKKLFNIARIVIALGLCYYLLQKIDIRASFAKIKDVNLAFFGLGIVLFLIFLLICNLRWKILLDARGMQFSFGYLLKVYFVSWFFNNILPTTVGGDVLRVAYTVKKDDVTGQRSTTPPLAATFVDRFIGFIGLFFFASLASLFLFLTKPGKNQFLLFNIIGFIILLIILLALFSDKVHLIFSWIFARIKFFNLGPRFERAYAQVKEYRKVKLQLLYCFLLSFIVQVTLALVWFTCAVGIKVTTSVSYYFLYIPVIGVLTMIPITIGGLGLRENLFVSFFTALGVEPDKAVAISILYLIVNLIFALLGGVAFLFIKREIQAQKAGGK